MPAVVQLLLDRAEVAVCIDLVSLHIDRFSDCGRRSDARTPLLDKDRVSNKSFDGIIPIDIVISAGPIAQRNLHCDLNHVRLTSRHVCEEIDLQTSQVVIIMVRKLDVH